MILERRRGGGGVLTESAWSVGGFAIAVAAGGDVEVVECVSEPPFIGVGRVEFRPIAVDFEGGHGSGGRGGVRLGLEGGDIPDVAKEAFDGFGLREVDASQVSGFALDENAAVGFLVESSGLEVATAQGAVALVIGLEGFGGFLGHLEDDHFLGGVDLNEEVAVPAVADSVIAGFTIGGFAGDGPIADEVGGASYEGVTEDVSGEFGDRGCSDQSVADGFVVGGRLVGEKGHGWFPYNLRGG